MPQRSQEIHHPNIESEYTHFNRGLLLGTRFVYDKLPNFRIPRSLIDLENLLSASGDADGVTRNMAGLLITAPAVVKKGQKGARGVTYTDRLLLTAHNGFLQQLLVAASETNVRCDQFVDRVCGSLTGTLLSASEVEEYYRSDLQNAVVGMWHEQNLCNFYLRHSNGLVAEDGSPSDDCNGVDAFLYTDKESAVAVNVKSNQNAVKRACPIMYRVGPDGAAAMDRSMPWLKAGSQEKPEFLLGLSSDDQILISMLLGPDSSPTTLATLPFSDRSSQVANHNTALNLASALNNLRALRLGARATGVIK